MSATLGWFESLHSVVALGEVVNPRGKPTLEILNPVLEVDMNRPVVFVPARKLNFKFMAAEALWILNGDDTTSIVHFNKNLAQFSDDGEKFFGAYGPRIVEQLGYVVDTLTKDESSRRAVLTTWRTNPPESKDIPCTVAMTFMIRDGYLNLHVFMRSSDVWLGVPYDVFSFSMVAYAVLCRLNSSRKNDPIAPGRLFLTAASSHLYTENLEGARAVVNDYFNRTMPNDDGSRTEYDATRPAPSALWQDYDALTGTLDFLRFTEPGNEMRWWEPKP